MEEQRSVENTVSSDTKPIAHHNTDKPMTGIMLAIAGFLMYSLYDISARVLFEKYPVMQVVFLSTLISQIFFSVYIFIRYQGWKNGWKIFASHHPRVHIIRAMLRVVPGVLLSYALTLVPLSLFYTLIFTSPLWATAFARMVFKQAITKGQAIAIILGFSGVLVAQKIWEVFTLPAGNFPQTFEKFLASPYLGTILCLIGAISIGIGFVLTRFINSLETKALLPLHSGWLLLVISAVMAYYQGIVPISLMDFGLILVAAVMVSVSMVFVTVGYQIAPTAVVAPMQYTQLIWGAVFGWLIWQEVPTVYTLIGAAILILCGWYIIHVQIKLNSQLG